jgi:predicted RNA-binding Zn ribbon-like protein
VDFGSYRDSVVATAAELVNELTAGLDGVRPVDVPGTASSRRGCVGNVTALAGTRVSATEVDAFFTLAARLRPVFEACADGDVDRAADVVNELLDVYRSAPHLIRHDGEPWHLHFHTADAGMADGWGAGCSTGLAIVIGSSDAQRLGVCTAAPCDRVYVDVSRNANRRFCSARCANRAALSAFRARRH